MPRERSRLLIRAWPRTTSRTTVMCIRESSRSALNPRGALKIRFASAPPQLLGETVGIPPVALLAAALGDPRDDDLVDVRTQRLVEPSTLDAFLEDQMLATRNPPDRLDQRVAVDFDREVREPLARHCEMTASV